MKETAKNEITLNDSTLNEKTIRLLEFDTIRSRVAGLALCEEAASVLLADEPRRDVEETNKLKSLVRAIMERMVLLGGEIREGLPALGGILSKLDVEGTVLETDEAYAIMIFLKRAGALKLWLEKPCQSEVIDMHGHLLTEALLEIQECGDISTDISKIIDNDGNLRDLPELREIRRRIRSLQKDIDSAGSRYANNEEKRRMLQSEIPSQRDGRLVLAVKANFRGRFRGIVHEVSSSGQTVFVEPEEVVEMNNELLIENRKLEAEVRRILRELTGRIAVRRQALACFHRDIVFIESIRARARYGFEHKGVFADDETGGKLVLKQARHPLLGSGAVPLDISMSGGIRTIIVTGPNTGGKTVALKTLGLLALMNQFGLALPVEEGSFLPVFDGVYADIGDEQSLSQSLSTFSGHMTNIAAIISASTGRSLVLLDELGSGTDPEEGSAIAMAILDHFIEKKIHLIVTTHHSILKNYGYTHEGVENASMEFDGRTLSPTFRIVMGIPGESRAMDIASRNGFPGYLVSRARGYLDEERADVSALIAGLKKKHKELDAAAEEGKRKERRLLEERRQTDLKELRLKQKELHLRSDGVGSLRNLLGESRKTLENLVREVKEGALDRDKTLKVKEFLSGLEAAVKAESESLEKEKLTLAEERRRVDEKSANSGKETVIASGVEVLAGEFRRRGRVLRQDRKGSSANSPAWIVEIGSVKLSFPESELVPLAAASSPGGATWAADLAPSSPLSMELSIRGMRLNEAIETLGRQIDAAILGGLGLFYVVHGKGDGILSKGVHDFLKNDPRVADYFFSRPESGGFGRTEIILK